MDSAVIDSKGDEAMDRVLLTRELENFIERVQEKQSDMNLLQPCLEELKQIILNCLQKDENIVYEKV